MPAWIMAGGGGLAMLGPIERVLEHTPEIDFESDDPLICPLDNEDGEPCEACQ